MHESESGLFTNCRAVLVRNFTLEPIEALLRLAAYRAGIHLDVTYSGYDPANEPPQGWSTARPDVFFVALRLEELAPALTRDFLDLEAGAARSMFDDVLDHVGALLTRIREGSEATIFLHNFAL